MRSAMRCTFALWLAAAGLAQIPTYPHLVLTRMPTGSPAAAIVAVDTATQSVTPLGRFPHDTLPPLAIALDPFDHQLVVAVELQPGTSRVVRLERTAAGLVEQPMCDVPGRVTAMWIFDDELVLASDGGGGVLRAPRRGGPATLHIPVANLTAMHGYGVNGPPLTLGWTGRTGTANPNPGVSLVDFQTGQPYLGPWTFAAQANVELTGAIDLPTGVPRQLLSFADGSFWLFAGVIGPPNQLTLSMPIPPGGAVAMAPISTFGLWPLALGGAAFPHLYEVDFWTGVVTLRSPALPGDPVDFCSGGDRAASGHRFTEPCGAQAVHQTWSGYQSPGSVLTLQAMSPSNPSPFLLLCLGLRDGPGLPVALPGGCLLHIAADAVSLRPLVGMTASQAVPIPNQQAFHGVILFAQWFDLGPSGISTSDAIAHHIGL